MDRKLRLTAHRGLRTEIGLTSHWLLYVKMVKWKSQYVHKSNIFGQNWPLTLVTYKLLGRSAFLDHVPVHTFTQASWDGNQSEFSYICTANNCLLNKYNFQNL